MAKKKGKSVSFDAMVKFFMNSYQIPTKRDIDALNARLDRIERMLMAGATARMRRSAADKSGGKQSATASDLVLDIVQQYENGIGFADIKRQTGYDDKKLRNILFRLNKIGKIKRRSRGIYEPA